MLADKLPNLADKPQKSADKSPIPADKLINSKHTHEKSIRIKEIFKKSRNFVVISRNIT
jgi:hypothetical protein